MVLVVKNPPANADKRHRFDSWVRKIPWSRKWQPTGVFLPGESHEQRSLVGYSQWGPKELDTTEHTCICILRNHIPVWKNNTRSRISGGWDHWGPSWGATFVKWVYSIIGIVFKEAWRLLSWKTIQKFPFCCSYICGSSSSLCMGKE